MNKTGITLLSHFLYLSYFSIAARGNAQVIRRQRDAKDGIERTLNLIVPQAASNITVLFYHLTPVQHVLFIEFVLYMALWTNTKDV